MKHGKWCKALWVTMAVVCAAFVLCLSASAKAHPDMNATQLQPSETFAESVYEEIVFTNVSSVEVSQEVESNFEYHIADAQNGSKTVRFVPQNIGSYDFTVIDTKEAAHAIHVNIGRVPIAFDYFTGLKNELLFNGKEQPFNLVGEYKGHPITFEVNYKDLIGPEQYDQVVIKGIGNFYGELLHRYHIALPKATIAKVTHYKAGFRVDVKPLGANYKYQLQLYKLDGTCLNYDMKTATSKVITGLTPKDKFCFRVRTYVTVNGKNKFSAGWTTYAAETVGLSLKDCKVSGVVNKVYTGKAQTQNVKVTYNGKPVKVKISYGDNKTPGYHYLTLTGTGNFTDSIKVYYHILPLAPRIKALIERYNEQTKSFSGFAVACQQPKSGTVNGYQYAVKMKGSNQWQFFERWGTKAHIIDGLKEGKIYYVMARAIIINGHQGTYSDLKTYGKWSAQERVYLCNKEMHTDYFYYTQDTIYGSVSTVFKGEKATVTVDGKTYTVVFTRDAKLYNFKLKIGKHKAGAKLVVQYLNKFGQAKIRYTTLTYYAKELQKGLSGAQVKLVPDFEQPAKVSKLDDNVIWEYAWQIDEKTAFYAVLTFSDGKLIKWEYYEVPLEA